MNDNMKLIIEGYGIKYEKWINLLVVFSWFYYTILHWYDFLIIAKKCTETFNNRYYYQAICISPWKNSRIKADTDGALIIGMKKMWSI